MLYIVVITNAFLHRMVLLESVLHTVFTLERGLYTVKLKICNEYYDMSVDLLFQSMQH